MILIINITIEHRKKVRPWETAYLNEIRLKQDLKTAHDAIKEVFNNNNKKEKACEHK